jgi:hypothetical protein
MIWIGLVKTSKVSSQRNIGDLLLEYLKEREFKSSEYGLYHCLLLRNSNLLIESCEKLLELSMSKEYPATLQKRIELLSLCLNIANSVSSTAESIIVETEDLLDVANIQLSMLQSTSDQTLNHHLLTVTELWNYCTRFDLILFKLDILYTCNYQDDNLTAQLMREVVERDLPVDRLVRQFDLVDVLYEVEKQGKNVEVAVKPDELVKAYEYLIADKVWFFWLSYVF